MLINNFYGDFEFFFYPEILPTDQSLLDNFFTKESNFFENFTSFFDHQQKFKLNFLFSISLDFYNLNSIEIYLQLDEILVTAGVTLGIFFISFFLKKKRQKNLKSNNKCKQPCCSNVKTTERIENQFGLDYNLCVRIHGEPFYCCINKKKEEYFFVHRVAHNLHDDLRYSFKDMTLRELIPKIATYKNKGRKSFILERSNFKIKSQLLTIEECNTFVHSPHIFSNSFCKECKKKLCLAVLPPSFFEKVIFWFQKIFQKKTGL